jgi:hypothetical protein
MLRPISGNIARRGDSTSLPHPVAYCRVPDKSMHRLTQLQSKVPGCPRLPQQWRNQEVPQLQRKTNSCIQWEIGNAIHVRGFANALQMPPAARTVTYASPNIIHASGY